MCARTAPPARKSTLSAQTWADSINASLRDNVRSILEVGQTLIQAKNDLGHGEWEAMFEEAEDNVGHSTVKNPIRFGLRTAQRYMAIAENPAIAKATDLSFFPPTLTVLEHLARYGERVIAKALKDGRVFPDMTMEDAINVNLTAKELKEKQTARREEHHEQVKRDLEDLIGGPSTYVKDSRRIAAEENVKHVREERKNQARFALLIIDLGFKAAALRHHPDKPGGNTKDFQALTAARDELKRYIS
jgi:hypothetical protein